MQTKHYADIFLASLFVAGDDFFIICINKECKEGALDTERRFDNIRNISCVLFLIEIAEVLAGCVLVLSKVVICAVGNAPKLAPAEREQELKVSRCL